MSLNLCMNVCGAEAKGRGEQARAALKRRRILDSDEPVEPIEAMVTPTQARQRRGGNQRTPARANLPQSLAGEVSMPSASGKKRFNWNEANIAMLLKGIEEYGSAQQTQLYSVPIVVALCWDFCCHCAGCMPEFQARC
jgi:hypothetical protein